MARSPSPRPNIADAAAAFGVTAQAVRVWRSKGYLVQNVETGAIDLLATAARLRENLSFASGGSHGGVNVPPDYPAMARRWLAAQATVQGRATTPMGAPAQDDVTANLSVARLRRTHWQSVREEVKAKRDVGTVVDLATVERVWFETTRTIRDRLLGLAPDIAAAVVGVTGGDLRLLEEVVSERMRTMLGELSDSPPEVAE